MSDKKIIKPLKKMSINDDVHSVYNYDSKTLSELICKINSNNVKLYQQALSDIQKIMEEMEHIATNSNIQKIMEQMEHIATNLDYVYPEMYEGTDDEVLQKMFNSNKPIRFLYDRVFDLTNIMARQNVDVKAYANVTFNISKNDVDDVLLAFGNSSKWENIKFVSQEPDLQWNRADITNRENINIINCIFDGFRHISDRPNSWGIYIQGSKNINIINCKFSNNSQSDIAIVEGCENININNASGENLIINLEPNQAPALKNITISNSNIHLLYILDNSFTTELIDGVTLNNCHIGTLRYRGGNIVLNNCEIDSYYTEKRVYFGSITNNNTISVSDNLLTDNKLVDIANSEGSTCWFTTTSTHSNIIDRVQDNNFSYVRLNPNKVIGKIRVHTSIDVMEGKTYLIKLNTEVDYTTGDSWIANIGEIRFIGADGSEDTTLRKQIICNQATIGNTSSFKDRFAFVVIPSGITKIHLVLSNNVTADSTMCVKIKKIGVYLVTNGKGHFSVDSDLNHIRKMPTSLDSAGQSNLHLAGETVYMINPNAGGYVGYICIESGNPGVWKGFGLIEN